MRITKTWHQDAGEARGAGKQTLAGCIEVGAGAVAGGGAGAPKTWAVF